MVTTLGSIDLENDDGLLNGDGEEMRRRRDGGKRAAVHRHRNVGAAHELRSPMQPRFRADARAHKMATFCVLDFDPFELAAVERSRRNEADMATNSFRL